MEKILKKIGAIRSREEMKEYFKKSREIYIDATDIKIQRPQGKQRRYYSGKRKEHTIKATIVVNEEGRVIYGGRIRKGTG